MRVLRAGLFERVSTEEQARFGFSIQTQIDALEEYCTNNKLKIVDHYCDDGVSAGRPYEKRPEMKRLLDDVEAGRIDIILFTRLDRWFRNVKEYFKVQEILDNNKVEWKAIWEDYDTRTSNGRMAITIFLAIAQAEREKTAERIKAVFENKRKNKEAFFGPSSTPFGYVEQKDENGVTRLVKNPELEDALQAFWDIAVKYENINKAGKIMSLKYGITKGRHKWNELAKKEIYTGTYKGVKDYCPAYVSRRDWERLLNRGYVRKAQANRVYLFTGLMECPGCKRNLSAKYNRRKLKTTGEYKEYFYYRCPQYRMHTCSYNLTVFELGSEQWLLDNVEKLIQSEIEEVEVLKNNPKAKPKVNVAALKEQLRRLEVVYMAGNKTDEEYIAEQNELNAAIKEAEAINASDPAEKDISHLEEFLKTDFRTIYESLDREEKRRLWRTLIKRIQIDGRLPVSVKFN